MGTAASSSSRVRTIKTSRETDSRWASKSGKLPQSSSPNREPAADTDRANGIVRVSSARNRMLTAVAGRLRSSESTSSSHQRRLQHLRAALDASEHRANDAQTRVRALERQMTLLQHRNNELAAEATWLKAQLPQRPEIPVNTSSSETSAPVSITTDSNISSQLQQASNAKSNTFDLRKRSGSPMSNLKNISNGGLVKPEDKSENFKRISGEQVSHEKENKKMRETHQKEVDAMRKELETMKKNLTEQIEVLQAQLRHSAKLNAQLEDVVRDNLSDAHVRQARIAAQRLDFNSSFTANASRAQFISDLNNQISELRAKIRTLENEIVTRDVEIADLKSSLTNGDAQSKQHSNGSHVEIPVGSSACSSSTQSIQSQSQNRVSSATQNNDARSVESGLAPGSAATKTTIAAVVHRAGSAQSLGGISVARRRSTLSNAAELDAAVGNNLDKEIDQILAPEKPRDLAKLGSAHSDNRSATAESSSNAMKNVFAFGDHLEPIRVAGTPEEGRPKTDGSRMSGSTVTATDVTLNNSHSHNLIAGNVLFSKKKFSNSEAPPAAKDDNKHAEDFEVVSVRDDEHPTKDVKQRAENFQVASTAAPFLQESNTPTGRTAEIHTYATEGDMTDGALSNSLGSLPASTDVTSDAEEEELINIDDLGSTSTLHMPPILGSSNSAAALRSDDTPTPNNTSGAAGNVQTSADKARPFSGQSRRSGFVRHRYYTRHQQQAGTTSSTPPRQHNGGQSRDEHAGATGSDSRPMTSAGAASTKSHDSGIVLGQTFNLGQTPNAMPGVRANTFDRG